MHQDGGRHQRMVRRRLLLLLLLWLLLVTSVVGRHDELDAGRSFDQRQDAQDGRLDRRRQRQHRDVVRYRYQVVVRPVNVSQRQRRPVTEVNRQIQNGFLWPGLTYSIDSIDSIDSISS